MKRALLFPGQGSQTVGMGKDFFSKPKSMDRLRSAEEILGYSISEFMFEGPAEKLSQTKFTQPAIFIHSTLLFESLDIDFQAVGGHSLGEFSALVASGAASFEDVLPVVQLRGKLMQKAGESHPGAMAAIIGMDDASVESICKEITESGAVAVPANYNSPGQLVISGSVEGVNQAVDQAKAKGCRMAKLLPVSGAFHSPLMESAISGLSEKLAKLPLKTPNVPLYSNFTAKPSIDQEVLRINLLRQLTNPVKWTQTLGNMKADGINEFVEIGPGKVLQGLVKRTLSDVDFSGYQ